MITVQEALKQIADGRDFHSPSTIIGGVTGEEAEALPEGCPYSIATQVFHMWFWQDRWLKQIGGEVTPPWTYDDSDFPYVSASEWEGVRERFISGFWKMQELSGRPEIFDRPTAFGDTVEVLIMRCALHNAYHLGQITLVRRLNGWIPD